MLFTSAKISHLASIAKMNREYAFASLRQRLGE
jgi:hypothetical protein